MSISGIAPATTTSKDSAESQGYTLHELRKNVIDESVVQRFVVSREEGTEELKRDILGYYKDKTCKLTAKPRVRFEGEEGVGSGPVREFFLCAMKLVHEGIGGTESQYSFSKEKKITNFRPMINRRGQLVHSKPLEESLGILYYTGSPCFMAFRQW